jgi:polyferredoxin
MGRTGVIIEEDRSILSSLKLGYLRHVVQAQVLILVLYGLAVSSLPIHILWRVDPILGISAALAGEVLPVRFLMVGGAMLLASLIVGRAFCGWICPLGFILDLLHSVRRLPGRLGRGPRICEGVRPRPSSSHLMFCIGGDRVIGHVIWVKVTDEGLGEPSAEGAIRGFVKDHADAGDFAEIREISLKGEFGGKVQKRKVLRLFEEFARDRRFAGIAAVANDPSTVSILREGGYQQIAAGRWGRAFAIELGKGPKIPESLRYLKYALLLGGLVMAAIAGWTFLEWITPLSVAPRGLGPIYGPAEGILVGLVVLVVAIAFTALTEERAWCRYVCPLGALLSLPSARKLVGIRLNVRRCIRCLRCERACTMGVIDVKGQSGLRWDSECIACMACRDACPVDAIGLAVQRE